VKALSTTSASNPLLSSFRILTLLNQAGLAEAHIQDEGIDSYESKYARELEWLLVSKATIQTYGLLLNTLLEQTIPISDDIWYWDEVLGSYVYTGLYTVQTSPLKLWSWTKEIYGDSQDKFRRLRSGESEGIHVQDLSDSLTDRWKTFYDLVRESMKERSVMHFQQSVTGPIAHTRGEVRRKQRRLRRLREMGASGLGVLMDEGLSFGIDDSADLVKSEENESQEWKVVVERSIALIDTVLCHVTKLNYGVSEFEDAVFAAVEEDSTISTREESVQASQPARLAERLQKILQTDVPQHIKTSQKLTARYGRPSRLTRYWLPATALLLSSTTIYRVFANRRVEIIEWVRNLGDTVQDFWLNWVVEPTMKVISTIRHDKDSELALMSKESLKGDRDSLERMVIEFATDHPDISVGSSSITESQVADIRIKIKEGDLTPVLKAYEKDLRKPLVGAIKGDLIRTLLIQVQKTKVDIEIAMNGIDSLLKSQELVFGFIGLTPGILVCFAAFRYLGGAFGSRKGLRKGRKGSQSIRVLRNIDRVLAQATPTDTGVLSYKDHGLLLCEVHELRKRAHGLFPGEIEREFLEDVHDLCSINSGVQAQVKVLQRIRWGYSKWLQA